MGVTGLWDLVRAAGTRTSLSHMAKDAFTADRSGLRALTVGVDASLWIFHAKDQQHGENPFLRTIFYKVVALLQHPVLPVFVFDGPKKPSLKRNQNVAGRFGTSDYHSRMFKDLLDTCGLEWWNAPGEAEAELALMNRQGKIDAVLSDDVDAFLFGATCLLRNNSPTLSGAQASSVKNASKLEGRAYECYRVSDILAEWRSEHEDSALKTVEDCRLAMVLIALLGGGDYAPQGTSSFGPRISVGLAHAGHLDFLKAYIRGDSTFANTRNAAVNGMIETLRVGSSFIGRKYPSRADELGGRAAADIFPASSLDAYLRAATSGPDHSAGWPGFGRGVSATGRGLARNDGRGDIEGMALACERFFEWGTVDGVCRKFAGESSVFKAALIDEARARVAAESSKAAPSTGVVAGVRSSNITSYFAVTASQRPRPTPTPSVTPSHLVKIYSTRVDPTDLTLNEYRVGYLHETFSDRCRTAMEGRRVAPLLLPLEERARLGLIDADALAAAAADEPLDPGALKDEVRVWLPEYLVRHAWPGLVTAYDEAQKKKKGSKKQPAATLYDMGLQARRLAAKSSQKALAPPPGAEDTEVDDDVLYVDKEDEDEAIVVLDNMAARRKKAEPKRTRSDLSSTLGDESRARASAHSTRASAQSTQQSSPPVRAPNGRTRRNVVRSPSPARSPSRSATSPLTSLPSSPRTTASQVGPSTPGRTTASRSPGPSAALDFAPPATPIADLPPAGAFRPAARIFSRVRSAPEPARHAPARPLRTSTRQNSAAPPARDVIDLCDSSGDEAPARRAPAKPLARAGRRRSGSAIARPPGAQPGIATFFAPLPSTPAPRPRAKPKQSPQWVDVDVDGVTCEAIDLTRQSPA